MTRRVRTPIFAAADVVVVAAMSISGLDVIEQHVDLDGGPDGTIHSLGDAPWREDNGAIDVEEHGLVAQHLDTVDPEAREQGGVPATRGALVGEPLEVRVVCASRWDGEGQGCTDLVLEGRRGR